MEAIARQLIYLRRAGRWLLVGQRLCQLGIAAAAALGLLATIDYLLRLPDWMRLALGVAVAAALLVWVLARLARALQFRPRLSDLALRAERLFPQLAGSFASAVEFVDQPERYREPARTRTLASTTVEQVRGRLTGVQLSRLLNPGPTLRWAGGLLIAVLALSMVGWSLPAHTAIAAKRWLSPLDSPDWPKRTEVVGSAARQVFAVESPIPVTALVRRGHEPGMRVRLHYRVIRPNGEAGRWQSALMTAQPAEDGGPAEFQRLVELPVSVRSELTSQPASEGQLEYTIEAGDDRTEPRRLKLAARPAVTGLAASVQPPDYARGLVTESEIDLQGQSGRTASLTALAGSRVRLELELNKPIPVPNDPTTLLPGLAGLEPAMVGSAAGESTSDPSAEQAAERRRFSLAFRLDQSTITTVALTDGHGLADNSDRRFRFEAREDEPPSVSLTEPAADRSVLPGALVDAAAEARDDVGARAVRIEAEMPEPARANDQRDPAQEGQPATQRRELAGQTGRQPSLSAAATLDLAEHDHLQPGDAVTLQAVAEDVFQLDGQTHEPVTSAARRLRIINEAAMIRALRDGLAGLRRQSVDLQKRQQALMEQSPAEARGGQRRVTDQLDQQRRRLGRLQQRMERNRLEEQSLKRQMEEADNLLQQAEEASAAAAEELQAAEAEAEQGRPAQAEAHEDKARQGQGETEQRLAELTSLLNQGRDALSLQLELQELSGRQQKLRQKTRELLPQTVGRSLEDLPDQTRQTLEDLARRQQELAEEGEDLVRQMQESARELRQSDEVGQQAAGEALSEAASIAQRQGLTETMEQAGASAEQNQLSQAGNQQARAGDTLEQMNQQLEKQAKRRQEMLQRRMQKLAELLRQLIRSQQRQIQALENQAGDELPALAEPQSQLRRRTMAARTHVEQTGTTRQAALPLGNAAEAQGRAVQALRRGEPEPAEEGQTEARRQLEQALEVVAQAREAAEQEEAQEQRQELRQQYQQLAERQRELRGKTAPLAGAKELGRRQQRTLRDLAEQEQALREEAEELAGQLKQTLVYKRIHEQIDGALGRAIEALEQGRASDDTLAEQDFAASMLEAMAEALAPEQDDNRFAEGQNGGGGGGGGGQGQNQDQAIPPVAELKLLRAGQSAVLERTARLAEAGQPGEAALKEVSAKQQDLAELGKQLLEQMQQQQQGGPEREAR